MRSIRPLLLAFSLTAMCKPDADGEDLRCDERWDDITAMFPDAGQLGECDAGAAAVVAGSLMVLDGLTIDNDGETLQPCVAVLCDADYAYLSSNNLPHYDFVPTTPNPLAAVDTVVRIPLAPTRPTSDDADPVDIQDGCRDAYAQHLADPDRATEREPSGLCLQDADDAPYLRETLASGESATYAKIACLGTTAVTIGGVTIAGPNEATTPDPYGNPFFYMPDTAGQDYLNSDLGMGAALDLCGGHTGGSFHYHGANAACFARDSDGKPARSYAAAAQAWDLEEMLQGACSEPSPILAWSPDGYPIKGPCVCADADCTTIKRARSSWVYAGLERWGDDPDEDRDLGVENAPCSSDDDCCDGAGCNFRCAPVLVEDAAAGTAVAARCALLDYAWCTHQPIDRSTDPGGDEFVYLDRCNGREGPDGYAYHATASFPFFQACYRGEPIEIPRPAMGDMGAGNMGGNDNNGMNPPACAAGQTSMCCGDGSCDGPETAANCAADC